MSFNNLVRNKRRCAFILITLVAAILLTTWVMAFFEGMNFQISEAVKKSNIGNYQYIKSENLANQDPYATFSLDEINLNQIKKIPYSPEFVLEGTLNSIYGNAKAVLIGIVPEKHNEIFPIKEHIILGSYQDIAKRKVLIGKALAKRNSLNIDDTILFHFQTKDGQLRSESLTVGGIFDINGKGFQEKFIYLHHDYLTQIFLGETKNVFHRLVFFQNEVVQNPNTKEVKLTFQSWKDLNPEMNVVTTFHQGIVNFILAVTAVAVFMIIYTPISILWTERLSEMKLLKTIGMTKKQMWTLSLSEAVILSLIAIGISLVLTSLLIAYSAKIGVDFSYLVQGKDLPRAGIDLPTHVFPKFHYTQYLYSISYIFLAIIMCYVFSTKLVTRKLKRVFS